MLLVLIVKNISYQDVTLYLSLTLNFVVKVSKLISE